MLEAKEDTRDRGARTLVDRVRKLDKTRRVVAGLRSGRRRVDVSGLLGSTPALLVEAMRTELQQTVVVCCADEEAAEDAFSDLATISTGRVRFFPAKDIFPKPFEIRENLNTRGRRSACLDLIHRGEADVVVTSLAGFLERTMSPSMLRDRTRSIAVGDTIDLEELREHLVDVGYENNPVVDELGQFAVRGSIVDVFDPSLRRPVRLEFFDDEVESIRTFDIDTQRSLRAVDSIRLLPATGVFVDDAALARLENRLRQAGASAQTIDEIVHEVELHRFSVLSRRYAPLLGMNGSPLDYFAVPPLLFFWDEERMGHAIASLEDEIEKAKHYTDDEYPFLDLFEYIHPPEHLIKSPCATVHVWDFSRKAGAKEDAQPVAALEDVVSFSTAEHPAVLGKIDTLVDTIRKLDRKGVEIHIYSESPTQRERMADMLEEDEHLLHLPVGWIAAGFVWQEASLAVLTDHQIFHRILPRPVDRRKTRRAQGPQQEHLQIGDFVVHVDYGIGRYVGLEKVETGGGETECLTLRYDGNDRIFVPVDQMPLVEKYVGKEGVVPSLDRLGSAKWNRTKARTKKALEEVARDMVKAYAQREIAKGHAFSRDGHWQKELEASFPYEETPDQLTATEDIKRDMESDKPMDRLICGDVGFGKTEVAIRAAFKAATDGKQVAVLVPTTVLALQHYKTFGERIAPFPLRVEMLSRFRSASEQRKIVKDLTEGRVDIVIGTHRLLSKDIAFRDLGLVIIDEEHRFGVKSKDKLKRLKESVDALSMTATPIPRTLYMGLSGIRPISSIETPPRNRHPIKTEVVPFDEETIERSIRYEIDRRGQVFFVHNRVQSIHSIQAFLERLLPGVRFGVGHGQMSEKELEKVILDFLDRKFDVLISTTIIESGLDFPNVNTIVIDRADRFGLAELYQLRGRVGRREQQAFSYLLVPRNFMVTEKASRRLQAMEEFEELGSGYRLAMRDLEIRGAGNLLGTEQHGQLVAVGFDLYCKMLRDAVESAKGVAREEQPPCKLESPLPSFLPDDYVEDQNERMALYKRLARVEDHTAVDSLAAEVQDRFGPPPQEALNLIELSKIKLQASAIGVALVRFRQGRVTFEFLPGRALEPRLCAELVETFQGRVLFNSAGAFGLTLTHGQSAYSTDSAKKLLGIAVDHAKM